MDRFVELIIPRSIVESISHHEIGDLMVGFTWRKNLAKQPRKLIQVGLIQLVGAGMIFMAGILPIDRALSIYSPPISQPDRQVKLILVNGAISMAILSGINGWILYRRRRLQNLLKLVEKIEQYNQIVRSIESLVTLTNLTTPTVEIVGGGSLDHQLSIVVDILTQTRHNLLTGLKIDRHLRQQSPSADLKTAFVESAPSEIAQNLIALQQLAGQPQLAEYATLLTQAWEIGISIDRAINLE
jgi:hypothetical protein